MDRKYHLRHPMGFLKPRLRSAVWTLALVVLFLPFIRYDNGIRCITAPCDSTSLTSPVGLALFHSEQQIYGLAWAWLVLGIVATYVVVSLVIATHHSKRH